LEEHNWWLYTAAFTVAFVIALIATPYAKKISIKLKAIDHPKARGLQKEPIPRIGGLAIVTGFLVSMLAVAPFFEEFRTIQFLGFIVGAVIIAILGILDDIYDLSAKIKIVVQLIAALIVVFTGTTIEMLAWPFNDTVDYLYTLSIPLTVVWIIGITNAVNLIDGVDGLAAGVSSICSFFLMVLCILTGSPMAVVFTAALAGSSLGFLPRNFNPAEIYMGDTGSTFLGYVLAVSSVMGLFKTYTMLAMLVAVLALALPILDTAFAMIRRYLKGLPLMSADRGHLHHRLIDRGYSQKQAVIILYMASIITGALSVLLVIRNFNATMIAILFLGVLGMMIFVYRKRLEKPSQ